MKLGMMAAGLVSFAIALPALAQAPGSTGVTNPEPLQWPQTGVVGEATLTPVVGTRTMSEAGADALSRAQLDRLRLRLVRPGAHPKGPVLRESVAKPKLPAPSWPASVPVVAAGEGERASGALTLFRNTVPTAVVPGGFSSPVNEPSIATKGNRVFLTMNWWAAQSTNDGAIYTSVDPFSGPAPPADNGFCCDQLAIYSPEVDTLFYMQQYAEDGTDGTQRWNVDQGFDGDFECYYDFTPASFNQGASGKWLDFADVALSRGHLFHSTNIFTTPGSAYAGAVVGRYPLAAMSTCQSISYFYFFDSTYGSFRLTQGATDTMYFAGHSTNSAMRIWKWVNGSSSLSTFDRDVTPWSDATRVCPGPDARDWCGFIDGRMTGGFHGNRMIGFMWTAAQDETYDFPQARVARFDVSSGSPTLLDEPVIHSPDTAFAYPSAAVNDAGELGGTMMYGGGDTLYPGCLTWIADIQNAFAMAPLVNLGSVAGTTGPSTNRSGDYLTTRNHYPNQSVFSGACFAYATVDSSTTRHTRFGRSSLENALFRNGFETANTLVWSSSSP